jgi:hypothetical protein
MEDAAPGSGHAVGDKKKKKVSMAKSGISNYSDCHWCC